MLANSFNRDKNTSCVVVDGSGCCGWFDRGLMGSCGLRGKCWPTSDEEGLDSNMNPSLTPPTASVSSLEDVKLGRPFRFEKECRLLDPPDAVLGDDPNKNLSAKVTGETALPPPAWDSVLRLTIDDPEIRLEVSENSECRFGLVRSLSLGKGIVDGLSSKGIGGGFLLAEADSFRKILKFLLDFKDLGQSEVVVPVGKCME